MVPAADATAEALERDCPVYLDAAAHLLFDRLFYGALLLASPFALLALIDATAAEPWPARAAAWAFVVAGVVMLVHMLRDRLRAEPFVLAADDERVYFEIERGRFVSVDWRHCRDVRDIGRGGGKPGRAIGFRFDDYPGARWERPTNAQLHESDGRGPLIAAPRNRGRGKVIEALNALRRARAGGSSPPGESGTAGSRGPPSVRGGGYT